MIIPDWLKQSMVTMLIPSIALVYSYAKIEFEVDRNSDAIAEVRGTLKERQSYLNDSLQLKNDFEKLERDVYKFLPVVQELSSSIREMNAINKAQKESIDNRFNSIELDVKEIKSAVIK